MIEINKVFFAFICAFAIIGALLVLCVLLYFIGGILDLTYYERHKPKPSEKEKNCPYEIEGRKDD